MLPAKPHNDTPKGAFKAHVQSCSVVSHSFTIPLLLLFSDRDFKAQLSGVEDSLTRVVDVRKPWVRGVEDELRGLWGGDGYSGFQ